MKIGIIGLGDIAQKAYLPVLTSKENIELVLCTRNRETLKQLAKKYRISQSVQTVEELIKTKIEAAFVSTATNAHYEIAKKLIENHINVYIDKPISLNFNETKTIVELAEKNNIIAMIGFNRRFAPMIKNLKEHDKANIIIMQKNRTILPGDARLFIVQDFIHVVDTLRFLMDSEVKDIKVNYLKKDNLLLNVVIELIGDNCTAIGIMNRNNGISEEIIEYMTIDNKYIVKNLVETIHLHHQTTNISHFNTWDSTLYKRGFYQIVDYFIDCVNNKTIPNPDLKDSLVTHRICEQIVNKIND